MVMTVLEAEVEPDRANDLRRAFEASGKQGLPPQIRESFLLHESGSDIWRLATVWNSREELQDYRASVDTPGGVLMFREAGAEPTLTINEVSAHLTQQGRA